MSTDLLPREVMTEHVVDAHGWIKTDEKLPANLETVLIWHDEVEDVQFAEFKMYSARRYEFTQGSDVLSIHLVKYWQSQPRPPTDWLPLDTADTEGDAK